MLVGWLYVKKKSGCDTPYSKWKIVPHDSSGYLQLFHMNTRGKDRKNPRRNYHLQGDVLKDSITGYLKYIVDHDAFRLKHPLPKPKKEHKKGTKAYI